MSRRRDRREIEQHGEPPQLTEIFREIEAEVQRCDKVAVVRGPFVKRISLNVMRKRLSERL